MKNNKVILVCLLISLIALASCSGGKGGFFKKKSSGSGGFDIEEIYKGTVSLVIDFRENMPESTIGLLRNVDDNSLFDGDALLGIDLFNQGAADIQEGYIWINAPSKFSLDKNTFQATEEIRQVGSEAGNLLGFSLAGKNFENPEGHKALFSVVMNVAYKDLEKAAREEISIIGCYGYQTTLGTEICIDKSIRPGAVKEKVCDVSRDLSFSGQGAPIVITEVKQIMQRDGQTVKPQFLLTLENKEKGEVAMQKQGEDVVKKLCAVTKIDQEVFDKVVVTSARVGSEERGALLNCKPQVVTLLEGIGKTKCEASLDVFESDADVFTSLLTVVLDYAYKIKEERRISVESLQGYVEAQVLNSQNP